MYWKWFSFDELSNTTLFDILSLRQDVFIIEQECIYQDADHLDFSAFHLICRGEEGEIICYARLHPPGSKYTEPSFGRLLTHANLRNKGLAKECVTRIVQKSRKTFGNVPLRISAQLYLKEFYISMGFHPQGREYDEDGIPHIEMVLEGD